MSLQVQLFDSNGTSGMLLIDETAAALVSKLMRDLGMTLQEVLAAAIFRLAVDAAIRRPR